MRVDIIPDAGCITDERVAGRLAVVIDVLRATTVMCTALHNGARRVIPVTTVEQCVSLYESLRRKGEKVLRGGERNTYRIDGFELDNSPLAYTREVVSDATVIMTTTNGTRTINSCLAARQIVIGSLLNVGAVARYVASQDCDVALVCSGRKNSYTTEDGYCAGMLAHILEKEYGAELSDFAWHEADFYLRYSENPCEALKHCRHFLDIRERLAGDVEFSLRRDIYNIVPKVYSDENGGCQEIR